MTFRNLTPALLVLATLSAPAHADALPPGFQPRHTDHNTPQASAPASSNRGVAISGSGDPLGYRPAPVPSIPGGASSSRLFDSPVTGSGPIAGPVLLASWRGAPPGWNPPGLNSAAGGGGRPDTYGDGRGGSCERGNASFCRPEPPDPMDAPDVPGPLPALGLGAAFAYSRKLRQRIK
jgi:hypothetical protein